MKRILITQIVAAFFLLTAVCGAHADIDLVDCGGDASCEVKIYRSDIPNLLNAYEIYMATSDIPASGIVTIVYDGDQKSVKCDAAWRNLPYKSGRTDLLNKIKCTVDSSTKAILANLRLFDQTTYDNPHYSEPGIYGYSELEGTSESNPFCVSDSSGIGQSCVWQKKSGDNWLVFGKTTLTGLSLAYSVPEGQEEEPLPENVCFIDSNQDGKFDHTEVGTCEETPQGDLCLVDAVQCLETTSAPICPDGSILNTETDLCEVTSDISCSAPGYIYNVETDMCEKAPKCTDGAAFNPNTDKCEILVAEECPTGYAYNAELNACTKNASCSGGGIYNNTTDKCELAYTPTCPTGYTYNSSKSRCEKAPTCPTGSTYSSSMNQCYKTLTIECPDGYVYHAGRDRCETIPTCPAGGSYYGPTDNCLTTQSYKCPVTDQSYGSSDTCNAACVQTGTCTPSYLHNKCRSETTNYTATFNYETLKVYVWYSGLIFGHQVSNFPGGYRGGYDEFPTGTHCQPSEGQSTGEQWNFSAFEGVYDSLPECPKSQEPAQPLLNLSNASEVACMVFPFRRNSDGTQEMGPTYYGIIDYTNMTYSCSLGGSYSSASACANGCAKTQACSAQCPAGYFQYAGICVANSTCSAGGELDTDNDACHLARTMSCDSGFTYDDVLGWCVQAPTCASGGFLDPSTDKCAVANGESCPTGFFFNATTQTCQTAPICNEGFLDTEINKCRVSASSLCPTSFTFSEGADKCFKAPGCTGGGSFSSSSKLCHLDAIHDCLTNTLYSGITRFCEAYPFCQAGAYRPDTDDCYEGDNTCPYGQEWPCMDYDDGRFCSKNVCMNLDDHTDELGDPIGAQDKEDDGQIDEDGNCLGQVYIFNGKDSRCRSEGMTIAFGDCCKDDDYLFGLSQCNGDEIQLAIQKGKGLCHYVGEYCSKETAFNVCIEKKKTYCCFNSKLGRIIHEQGRPQTKDFDTWGSGGSPICRGFTPEEFQTLDFAKIEMDEWIGDIQTASQEKVMNSVSAGIQNFYNSK
jgi:conjugal transfer mating pair stabilization protein TraN